MIWNFTPIIFFITLRIFYVKMATCEERGGGIIALLMTLLTLLVTGYCDVTFLSKTKIERKIIFFIYLKTFWKKNHVFLLVRIIWIVKSFGKFVTFFRSISGATAFTLFQICCSRCDSKSKYEVWIFWLQKIEKKKFIKGYRSLKYKYYISVFLTLIQSILTILSNLN